MGPNRTQAEGFILGIGAKIFTVAGLVIIYGVSGSVVLIKLLDNNIFWSVRDAFCLLYF